MEIDQENFVALIEQISFWNYAEPFSFYLRVFEENHVGIFEVIVFESFC